MGKPCKNKKVLDDLQGQVNATTEKVKQSKDQLADARNIPAHAGKTRGMGSACPLTLVVGDCL